jgi:hypothetical protein
MGKNKKWVVTTSGNRSLNDVEKELTDNGFAVDQVLDAIGIITGEVTDDDVVDRLRAIPGVTDVEPDADINIGPPGAPDTW